MRIIRRRILNLAGAIFLLALLARIVFLITGLRSYAARPEVPMRLVEMLTVLLPAVYTYFFSKKYAFFLMIPACIIALVPAVISLAQTMRDSSGDQPQNGRVFFGVLLIAGYVLFIALSILVSPLIHRHRGNAVAIRVLSLLAVLIFAAQVVYQLVLLVSTLVASTYPHEFETKYYYVLMAAYFGMSVTGIGCFLTAWIDPNKKHTHHESAMHPTVVA